MNILTAIDDFSRRCWQKLYEISPPPTDPKLPGGGKYLIIQRCAGDHCGLFSIYASALSWMIYAEAHQLIPIVDLQTYLNPYLEWWEVGRRNAWDFYFDQPTNLSLPAIKRSGLSQIVHSDSAPNVPSFYNILSDEIAIAKWRRVASRYAPVKDEALCEFKNQDFEDSLSSGVVGVLARGTDHVKLRLKSHYIQPNATQLIGKADSFLDRLPTGTRIYLVTEDAGICRAFQKHYGAKLILSKQHIADYHDGPIAKHIAETGRRKEHGAAYLKAVYDLSRCQYLIAGRNNGMKGAMILSAGFTQSYIFNLGTYDNPLNVEKPSSPATAATSPTE